LNERVLNERVLNERVLNERVLNERVLNERVLNERVLNERVLNCFRIAFELFYMDVLKNSSMSNSKLSFYEQFKTLLL